jgi:UDP-N-acetylmuramyl pentapeptide phosphotransferase/UDP-N-acetylglucosamine-1-phosphate transferase
MPWPLLAAAFLLPLAASAAGTWALLLWLRRIALLDHPNARSLHAAPVPRGGGLAPVAVLLAAVAALALAADAPLAGWLPPLAGSVLLAAVGWRDDRGGLGPLAKLARQAAAVAVGLLALAEAGPVFQGWLPQPLDLLLAGLAWLWFVNLYNFMDGSDGMAAGEAAAIGLGLALIGAWLGWPVDETARGLALAGAALGFLLWNRPPARLFLGDAGSLPLGYLIGWLLLAAAAHRQWAAALILPGYFLADATWTLLRRAARGENLLAAHAEHFYQQAVRIGHGHRGALVMVSLANLVLIAFAFGAARGDPGTALLGAAVTVAYLLYRLVRPPRPAA